MSGVSRLMYKWLAPTTKELRFAVESRLGLALDWSNDENERNVMMYESAVPLAKLYQPLVKVCACSVCASVCESVCESQGKVLRTIE
jgi:hypothetical protein